MRRRKTIQYALFTRRLVASSLVDFNERRIRSSCVRFFSSSSVARLAAPRRASPRGALHEQRLLPLRQPQLLQRLPPLPVLRERPPRELPRELERPVLEVPLRSFHTSERRGGVQRRQLKVKGVEGGDSKRGVGGETRREKSLRIGVHHADAVAWGPV
eukprot:31231-Pelagococcus_subviridis.AAC.8